MLLTGRLSPSFVVVGALLLFVANERAEAITCGSGTCNIFPGIFNNGCQLFGGIFNALIPGFQSALSVVQCQATETKCMVVTYQKNDSGIIHYVKVYRCATQTDCSLVTNSVGSLVNSSTIITTASCCADPTCSSPQLHLTPLEAAIKTFIASGVFFFSLMFLIVI